MPTSARHPCTNSIKEDITLSQYEKEINRRRTFAIISHPDAGKTTLTEKFLLYGGAIAQAGQVKGKKNTRAATSDWMEIEKQRGISVTSSVMQFQYEGYCINILDTPGHQDFSEDTYRTLMAADSAVMVIDAAKGVEAQTRKLFKVCAMRDIPIFTFINKMDREARDSFELLEELEKELGIETYPVNWPIGCGKEFQGVYDRGSRKIIHFTSNGGAKAATATEVELGDPNLDGLIGERLHQQLTDEIELLDGAAAAFDLDRVRHGKLSPVFFGSALTNFAVEPFLEPFLQLYHVQGGKKLRLSRPQQLMAAEREIIEEAYAGDIIGVFDPGIFSIGDTLCAPGKKFRFDPIPTFAPEHFKRVRSLDTMKRKQFLKGMEQIAQEGAIQIFKTPYTGMEEVIVGVVGTLQFDVLEYRLRSEYNVELYKEGLPYEYLRWIVRDDPDAPPLKEEDLLLPNDAKLVEDYKGNQLLLFAAQWSIQWVQDKNKDLKLAEFGGAKF